MSKFVIKNIDAVKGALKIRQLVIVDASEDNEMLQKKIDESERLGKELQVSGVLDDYERELDEKYTGSFRSILAIMNRVANLQSVSREKFKDVTPKKEMVKEYEFKYQDLRVYAIKIPNGQLVLLGGFKNQQKKDFVKFRSLKRQYLESIIMR